MTNRHLRNRATPPTRPLALSLTAVWIVECLLITRLCNEIGFEQASHDNAPVAAYTPSLHLPLPGTDMNQQLEQA